MMRKSTLFVVVPLLLVLAFGVAHLGGLIAPEADARRDATLPAAAATHGDGAARPAKSAQPPSSRTAAVSGSTALPAPATPLAESFTDLLARTNRGDAAAASRLYRDLSHCMTAAAVIQADTRLADDVLARPAPGTSAEQQQSMLDFAQAKMETAARLKTLCDGVTDDMRRQLAPVALQAAQLGDAAARDCYVHRGPMVNPQGMIDSPESLDQYRAQAPGLIDAAIAQGDWKMVDMLAYAYGPGSVTMLAGIVGHDPVQRYRYLKLFQLGADSSAEPRLERQLAEAASALGADQVAAADAWAQTTFEQHFSGSSTEATPPHWNACAVPDE